MKKLILLFVAAVCTTGLMAQPGQADTKRVMKVKTTDGKTVNYELSDIQEIAFTSPNQGEMTQAQQVAGSHQGVISVSVGGQTYENPNVTYVITANADGTVNVVVPEFGLENTIMGNLTIGSYTIQNVAYDDEKASFYRDYTGDGLSLHFKAVANGITTMDKDYSFDRMGNITVTAKDGGLTIVNNFQPGVMPFPITTTFVK